MNTEFNLLEWIEKELFEEFQREWRKQIREALYGTRLSKQHVTFTEPFHLPFTGLFHMSHPATNTVWGFWERPKTFTPKQFDRLWNSFSEKRKVEYVLSLIT